MPVDFQVRDAKVAARGALVLVMHATEIADGNGIQKLIAKESIKTLSGQDYCGVMQWDGNERWITGGGPLNVGQHRTRLLGAVDRMVPGDMPDFEPAMQLADQGFRQLTDAAIKHMVVISDGDPSEPSPNTLAKSKRGRRDDLDGGRLVAHDPIPKPNLERHGCRLATGSITR